MNLLVGYDNTETAEKALDLAKKYAVAFNAKLFVLTTTSYGPELETPEYDEIKAKVDVLKETLAAEGIESEVHLMTRSLSPGEDLIDFARGYPIDKIILGTKRKSKIGKLIMGSTAQYVILEADCPVVVVK